MIRVRVPATSANMGPGFDSLGIAFNLYNEYGFSEIDSGVVFKGIPEEFCNTENIIYEAMIKCFKKGQYKFTGIKIEVIKQDVPISRGLGSSSSCIVAGLVGANCIMGNKFTQDELLNIAVEMEGHPDNVAPAMFGDMIVAVMEEKVTVYNKIHIKPGIKFIGLIPDFRLSTKEARDVLPKQISIKQGIYNISRAALMVSCFSTGNYETLKYACGDALHQNYRSKLIKYYDDVYNECYKLGAIGCFLSGAGPTIMAIIKDEDSDFLIGIKNFLKEKNINWNVVELEIDNHGAVILGE